MESGPEAVRLDGNGRVDSGKALGLSSDLGTNPAWLHRPAAEEEKKIVQLIPGHYTRALSRIAFRLVRLTSERLKQALASAKAIYQQLSVLRRPTQSWTPDQMRFPDVSL